jgi:hypothetical protein
MVERAAVEEMGSDLATSLREAHARHGGPLPVGAYEQFAPDGTPWLPRGLPDNPLTPSVAWVWEGCTNAVPPRPAPDWLVCMQDGTLRAGALPDSPEWRIIPGSSGD